MATVCAVVLTYNRKGLLAACLDAVLAQTQRCDRVVVINNASTDGTADMLDDDWADRVDAYSLPRNIGAAGGFNAGMRLGYQTGTDFIWVMDDDVIPEPDALERLLAGLGTLAQRGASPPFMVSAARSPDGVLTNVPEIDRRRNALSYEDWPCCLEQKLAPVTRATFVSILIPRATLQQHGLPLASMFIWGEDSEFTVRVTQQHPGYLAGDSRVTHVRELGGVLDIRREKNPARVPYFLHLKRNETYLKRRYGKPKAVAKHLYHQLRLSARLCLMREFARAGIVLEGTLRGLAFNPVVEAADAPFDMAVIRHTGPGGLQDGAGSPDAS